MCCASYVYGMIHFRGDTTFSCSSRLFQTYSYPSESFGVAFHLSLGSWKQVTVSLASKICGKVQVKHGKKSTEILQLPWASHLPLRLIYRRKQKGALIRNSCWGSGARIKIRKALSLCFSSLSLAGHREQLVHKCAVLLQSVSRRIQHMKSLI